MVKKRTRQREAIITAIRMANGPLTIAEIHERAEREVAGIGIATVYRALGTMRAEGEISKVTLPGEEPRYEAADRGHHDHFRCVSCEQTFDLEGCPLGIPRGTMLPGGYSVEDHSLTLYGKCSACSV